VRLSLVRTVSAKMSAHEPIKVENEEVGFATQTGCPANYCHTFNLNFATPTEVIEKHPFNTCNGKTQYGSVLAPSFTGKLF